MVRDGGPVGGEAEGMLVSIVGNVEALVPVVEIL